MDSSIGMTLKKKMLYIMMITAVVILYARTVPQISLVERAVVLGLGLDYGDGVFTVSAQIIKPTGAGQENSSDDSYGVVSAKDSTISGALNIISQKTGLTASLSQCNVLVLGKSLVSSDYLPAINYLVSKWQLPELAVVTSTAESAEELFRINLVMTKISAFQMQQTLLSMGESLLQTSTTIKEFISNMLSESGTAAVSYISKRVVPKDDVGDDDKDEVAELDYFKTAVFKRGVTPVVLDESQTRGYNYLSPKTKKGEVSVFYDGVWISLRFDDKKMKKKLELKNGRAKVTVDLTLPMDVSEVGGLDVFFSVNDIDDETIKKLNALAEERVKAEIESAYARCAEYDCDVFSLNNSLYSAFGRKWKKNSPDGGLSNVEMEVNVDVGISRK